MRIRRIQLIRKMLLKLNIHWPLYPAGHYYSPVVDRTKLKESSNFSGDSHALLGIQYNERSQLDLLQKMSEYYEAMDFSDHKSLSRLYYFDNPFFSYSDGTVLHLLLAHKRPQRIIEIGSGYSTACMIDTISQYDIDCKITSIDIDSNRLNELIPEDQRSCLTIINSPLQEVVISLFKELGQSDLLFIDSSHVSKSGSELNDIFFNILPQLSSGVIIHFHDIFQDFEYPIEWIEEGISFNESYLLRSFIQYNSEFEILLFMAQLQKDRPEVIEKYLPKCMQPHERYNYGKKKGQFIEHILGQSLYIIKH